MIGQCLAGVGMFSCAYPSHAVLSSVAVVRDEPHPALRWVCHRCGVNVVTHPEDHIRYLQRYHKLPPVR